MKPKMRRDEFYAILFNFESKVFYYFDFMIDNIYIGFRNFCASLMNSKKPCFRGKS